MAVSSNNKKTDKKILEIAKSCGIDDNYFFKTTFERYQVQLNILEILKRAIENEPTLVTKEYVKGRENKYTHPAIAEYNKTANSANQTVQTLVKIITAFRDDANEEDDEFLEFLSKKK